MPIQSASVVVIRQHFHVTLSYLSSCVATGGGANGRAISLPHFCPKMVLDIPLNSMRIQQCLGLFLYHNVKHALWRCILVKDVCSISFLGTLPPDPRTSSPLACFTLATSLILYIHFIKSSYRL